MNIYLDVDGVLIRTASSKEDISNLVKYILSTYPESTYWLTSFARQGNYGVKNILKNHFQSELLEEMMQKIKVAGWNRSKTEGIKLTEPFIWFDDNLGWQDKMVLNAHGLRQNHFLMDPQNPEMAKKALARLKELS